MSRAPGLTHFPKYGRSARALLPRSLATTHQERHRAKLLKARGRELRRLERRTIYNAQVLIAQQKREDAARAEAKIDRKYKRKEAKKAHTSDEWRRRRDKKR